MTPNTILSLVAVLAVVAAMWLLNAWLDLRKKASTPAEPDLKDFPYLSRDSLLRPGERAFFPSLRQACADRSLIFTQVQLSKLIYPRAGIPKWQSYQNKIDRKSVDFVLCDLSTFKPQLIIELDDKSHTSEDRKERDDFVNRALAAAGIPILRVPAAPT